MGPAAGAAPTRLKAFRRLRHPVLGYGLSKPHRATDDFLDAVAHRGDERRRLYDDAFAAVTPAAASPEGGRPCQSLVGSSPADDEREDLISHVEGGAPVEMDEAASAFDEEDVFGHGGLLDEPSRCGEACSELADASCDAGLAVEHRAGQILDALDSDMAECGGDAHLADTDGVHEGAVTMRRRITRKRPAQGTAYEPHGAKRFRTVGGYDDACDASDIDLSCDPALRMVPLGHIAGAGGKGTRTVPERHVATQPPGHKDDGERDVNLGSAVMDDYCPTPRMVPSGHIAGVGGNGLRMVPEWHVATRLASTSYGGSAAVEEEGSVLGDIPPHGARVSCDSGVRPVHSEHKDTGKDTTCGEPGSSTDGNRSLIGDERAGIASLDSSGSASPTHRDVEVPAGSFPLHAKRGTADGISDDAYARHLLAAERIAAVRERVSARCNIAAAQRNGVPPVVEGDAELVAMTGGGAGDRERGQPRGIRGHDAPTEVRAPSHDTREGSIKRRRLRGKGPHVRLRETCSGPGASGEDADEKQDVERTNYMNEVNDSEHSGDVGTLPE